MSESGIGDMGGMGDIDGIGDVNFCCEKYVKGEG